MQEWARDAENKEKQRLGMFEWCTPRVNGRRLGLFVGRKVMLLGRVLEVVDHEHRVRVLTADNMEVDVLMALEDTLEQRRSGGGGGGDGSSKTKKPCSGPWCTHLVMVGNGWPCTTRPCIMPLPLSLL